VHVFYFIVVLIYNIVNLNHKQGIM